MLIFVCPVIHKYYGAHQIPQHHNIDLKTQQFNCMCTHTNLHPQYILINNQPLALPRQSKRPQDSHEDAQTGRSSTLHTHNKWVTRQDVHALKCSSSLLHYVSTWHSCHVNKQEQWPNQLECL